MKKNKSNRLLLQKWIQGDANAKEEQQLIDAAKDDIFLKSAMEGFLSSQNKNQLSNINALRQQFHQKTKTPTKPFVYLIRTAAAIVIIGLGGLFWWINTDQTETLADKVEIQAPIQDIKEAFFEEINESSEIDTILPANSLTNNSLSAVEATPPVEKSTPQKPIPAPEMRDESIERITQEHLDETEAVEEMKIEPKEPKSKKEISQYTPPPPPTVTEEAAPTMSMKLNRIQESQINTYQRLSPQDSVGFTRGRLATDSNTTVFFNNLNGSSKTGIYPVMGWEAFERYIVRNRKIPKEAQEKNISGTVIISFEVKKNGKPSAFKVIKSLGFGWDKEAIRLIKKGPRWINTEKTYPVISSYEFKFNL
ncbi:MAG: TonB family protein [Bacteroidota bacterium]